MNILKLVFEPHGGMYREFEGLITYFEPKDPVLYRKLLPQPFGVPSQPVVMIFLADYLRVVPWPLKRYQEWSILLKCDWKGREGWYPLTMPVTTWLAMMGGRYIGFPKYIADEISLTRSGESRGGVGKYKGAVQLALEFKPGITRPLTTWEQEFTDNVSFFKGDALQLVSPGRGPRVLKVTFHNVTEPKWSPEPGMIWVRANPGETWAGLLPGEGPFPGTYNHFTGGANLVAERLA